MDVEALRSAFLESIPLQSDGVPPLKYLYIPPAHVQALHPDYPLVKGIRGAGKSVWWSLLQSEQSVRNRLFPKYDEVRVRPGFGQRPDPTNYPGPDTMERLLADFSPRLIWRTVILWGLPEIVPRHLGSWEERAGWVKKSPEPVEQALHAQDQSLLSKKHLQIVVFDALDRTTTTWDKSRQLLDGLLQNLLEFRNHRAIRLKAFVRPDMLDGQEVGRFPDASKVTTPAVELRWPRLQLFGLLWQHLLNAPGDAFRKLCSEQFSQLLSPDPGGYLASSAMNTDEELQKQIFSVLAGELMEKGKRRGRPYTWLPSHLSDSLDQASPRSFLAALRVAAEISRERYGGESVPLHYEAIKSGVQKASQIRVGEVKEDFPWVEEVMRPLAGLTVPCEQAMLDERWRSAKISQRLSGDLKDALPHRSTDPITGLCEHLCRIGIFARMSDERINLPDVYRVGFGLRRRGGVKPLR